MKPSMTRDKYWILALAAAAGLAACERHVGEHETNHEEDEHEEAGHAESVTLAASAIRALGITWATAGAGVVEETCILDGEVVFDPARLQHVTAPYPGVVRALKRRLGDRVRPGDVMAIVENTETLRSYELRAAIAGTVIEEHAPMGEVLETSHEAFTVADVSRVWVEAQVFPGLCETIRVGQKAQVSTKDALSRASSRVDYVSPHFERETRSGVARVVLDNAGGQWRPGMFVRVQVAVGSSKAAIVVPATAVFRHDDGTAVVVRSSDGEFSLRDVRVGRAATDAIEIVEGLAPGDTVVSAGVFVVRSEILKGSLEPDHDH